MAPVHRVSAAESVSCIAAAPEQIAGYFSAAARNRAKAGLGRTDSGGHQIGSVIGLTPAASIASQMDSMDSRGQS